MECKICRNKNENKVFKIREMMFGTQETFDYIECHNCGCLQIYHIPKNIGKYYKNEIYLSFKKNNFNFIKQFLKKKRNEFIIKNGLIGKIINHTYPNPDIELLSLLNMNKDLKILDVGCGAGELLYSLSELNFKNLVGIEPFMNKEEIADKNLRILKKTLHDLNNNSKFNLIIFRHSFEHMFDQLEILLKTSKLLSENGKCLIKMPLKGEYIWNRYGTNWVQIDAPRHFLIHTIESFNLLIEKTDLKIQKVIFDSTEFQFWGSEQYKQDIALESEYSYAINPKKSIFTDEQIAEFKKKANELNGKKIGDQATFILCLNNNFKS